MRPLPGPPTIPRKGIDMRRLLALPITAFLALLLTGTVAAGGPNVQNISGGATIPQADWETSDANGGYTSGYAAASVEQGQSAAYLEFSQQSVTWVLCSDAGTPNDESDDVPSVVHGAFQRLRRARLSLDVEFDVISVDLGDAHVCNEGPLRAGEAAVEVAANFGFHTRWAVHIVRLDSRLPGNHVVHRSRGCVRFDGRTATGQLQHCGACKNTDSTPQAQPKSFHQLPSMR